MSHSIRTGAAILASTVLAFALSSQAGTAPQTQARAVSAPVEDADLAAREARMIQWIHAGRLEGWLSVPEARERYRELRRLKLREAEMRATTGGVLVEADRAALDRALHEMAQDMRWTREHNQHGRPYRPH